MLLLYLQDPDLNTKHLKMSVLADCAVRWRTRELYLVTLSCVTTGPLTLGIDGLSVSCSQTPAWPTELSLCCSDTVVAAWKARGWHRAGCNGPSASPQGQDRFPALLLWNPALPSELRDQQCVFPVAQSSWHMGTPRGSGKVCEPAIALALLLSPPCRSLLEGTLELPGSFFHDSRS